MTREEIDRYVAGIQALRAFRNRSRGQRARNAKGFGTSADYNPNRRVVQSISRFSIESDVAPVDLVFSARGRTGWLPRGGDE